MFGNKLRSWMEAHLVRPRKKQQRKLREQKALEQQEEANKLAADSCESKSPASENHCYLNGGPTVEVANGNIAVAVDGGPAVLAPTLPPALIRVTREKLRDERPTVGLNNLSSPESAYSTGYSTDGTSPGASVPPEYYINLRTGKHYVAPPPPVAPPVVAPPVTPRSQHRSRSTSRPSRPPLPESSTEEDIANEQKHHKPSTPKCQKKVNIPVAPIHRRTESFDDCHHRITGSPYLTASPRQRNRIRTNPWHHAPPATEDSAGSTLSSGSVKPDQWPLAPLGHDDSSSTLSSTANEKPRHVATPLRPPPLSSSPCSANRLRVEPITTCSPNVGRPCRHPRHPRVSSSSSSAPSSGSDTRQHTSDFSDLEEDATLNEIMGKYDESYVYEKETDILSDSDPTDNGDCYGDSSDLSNDRPRSDLDFIDNGSLNIGSDSEKRGKPLNKGHCSYHGTESTPEGKRRTSRPRKPRPAGDCGSQASSRASSRTRRTKRALPKRSEDISSSSEMINGHVSRTRLKHTKKNSIENSPCKYPVYGNLENGKPGPINLNKVLMDRIINSQRVGSRSADTTPILKRHNPLDYNGKYLRNPHVSKLISSNNSLMERRPSLEPKISPRPIPPEIKRRSNSLNQHASHSGPPSPRVVDKDGDLKCRRLIREAENMIEDYHLRVVKPEYLSPTLSTKSAILPSTNRAYQEYLRPMNNNCLNEEINSQISLLQEKIHSNSPVIKTENDDGILKTISKTLERIMIRDGKKDKKNSLKKKKSSDDILSICSYNLNNNNSEQNYQNHNQPNSFNVEGRVSPMRYCRSNSFGSQGISFPSPSFRRSSGKFEDRPKLRGVDYIRTTDPSYSPLRMSPIPVRTPVVPDIPFKPTERVRPKLELCPWPLISPDEPKSPLTPFKSFDLGNRVAHTSRHCPQSEPVKRKVYAGSSTFGKLQKTLMRDDSERNQVSELTTENLREENASLKEKVEQLRKERLKVEARVKEAQDQIDRLNFNETSSRC